MHSGIKFGVEIEVGQSPSFKGADLSNYVTDLMISKGFKAESRPWQYTSDNSSWVCKPDSSCGIEICSPVLFFEELNEISKLFNLIKYEKSILIDDRCAIHVHLDVSKFIDSFYSPSEELCSILAWWIKCEHIFMDFAAKSRKRNKYCRCIGLTDYFSHDDVVLPETVFKKMSNKYLTLNTFHSFNKRRRTIEFRLAESTFDFCFLQNWVSTIFCFAESALKAGTPNNYCWISPVNFFDFMKFESENLRNWFVGRTIQNCGNIHSGFWCFDSRKEVFSEYLDFFSGSRFG